jgi:hypothetical protein
VFNRKLIAGHYACDFRSGLAIVVNGAFIQLDICFSILKIKYFAK